MRVRCAAPLLPSGWSRLARVRHLTLDVERFWFQGTLTGDRESLDELFAIGDDSWRVSDAVSADDVLSAYQRARTESDRILLASNPAASPAYWPSESPPGWRPRTVRNVILHALAEMATHGGHLDAARELIDGRQWLVLTS
jgi:hypothetical protein